MWSAGCTACFLFNMCACQLPEMCCAALSAWSSNCCVMLLRRVTAGRLPFMRLKMLWPLACRCVCAGACDIM